MIDPELSEVLLTLERKPPSTFLTHDALCCRVACSWFQTMARSTVGTLDDGPGPLIQRWHWGPCVWPLRWCQAVRARELDCGGLAQLAETALSQAGHSVVRIQLINRVSPECAAHWATRWSAVPCAPRWVWGDLVYHEAVGVVSDGALRVWDPTESRWHVSETRSEHGQSVAIRIPVPEAADVAIPPRSLRWEFRVLPLGRWMPID